MVRVPHRFGAMVVPPLSLSAATWFSAGLQRMLAFVALRVRRSDQGMRPALSAALRAQTVALHRRLTVLAGAFDRLAMLARAGRLRVYPDRASPPRRGAPAGAHGAVCPPAPPSPFGTPASVAQGPSLPAAPTRGFGWMLGFMPAEYRDALARLLGDPEMAALVGASRSMARLLRPLCRGLGVAEPDGVFPAPRPRASRARPARARPARAAARAAARDGAPHPQAPPSDVPCSGVAEHSGLLRRTPPHRRATGGAAVPRGSRRGETRAKI